LIVLVPMLAVFVLLVFVSKEEHGSEADARLASAVQTATALYGDAREQAAREGRELARDPALTVALGQDDRAALRSFVREAVARPEVEAAEVLDAAGRPVARAGSGEAIAFADLALEGDGSPAGTLRVSTALAQEPLEDLSRLTGRQAVLIADGVVVAGAVEFPSTPEEADGDERKLFEPGATVDVEVGGEEHRARAHELDAEAGEVIVVLGSPPAGGLLTVPPVGAALLLVLLLVATGVAYTLARTLTELHDQVAGEAVTDPLTGLYNRRRLEESLSREVDRATRFGHELALLIADVDEFKQINDTRGHVAGDAVLRAVSSMLQDMTRTIDIGVRYGGDELAMIVIETGLDGGERLAERLRAGVAAMEVPVRLGEPVRATVSIGVAAVPDSATDTETLVDVADQALLEAKRAGKNQIRTG
jgi:diguanylate cyclase (GGDEF)-like protein